MLSAEFCDAPRFAQTQPRVYGVKRRGLEYEKQVCEKLRELETVGLIGLDHPWVRFTTEQDALRYAQPDWLGIDVANWKIVIVEVKLSRVMDAWWQLNQLYKPVVEKLFPEWDIALVEVVSNLRPVFAGEAVPVIRSVADARVGVTACMKVPYAK